MSGIDFKRYKRLVQFFWDPEPRNDDNSNPPIWCLGIRYGATAVSNSDTPKVPISRQDIEAPTSYNGHGSDRAPRRAKVTASEDASGEASNPGLTESDENGGWPSGFLDDFESRIWLTYRADFPTIKKSLESNASASISLSVRLRSQLVDQGGFTSDTGWGYWRRGSRQGEERQLLAMFADNPNAPFSIHSFVQHGASACEKHPGEWFGPSATARCIKALVEDHAPTRLKVYITGDGADVYEDSFLKLARADDGTFTPTLILVGIRLGIDRVTPAYWEALKASLELPQSVGIAGGRPSSSHYFVGVQGRHFFYLDPHQPRPALPLHQDVSNYTDKDVDSCHTRRLRRLSIEDMDPSMLIGFLIKDATDWKSWRRAVGEAAGKPVVHVANSEPTLYDYGGERPSAVDDVESVDEDEEDGELIEHPF